MRRELAVALLLTAALSAAPGGAAAGQAGAEIELSGGGLSVRAPAQIDLPPVRLAGADVTVEAPLGAIDVLDTRSGLPGWTLVASAGPPLDARGRAMGARLVAAPAAGGVPPGVRLGLERTLDAPRALAEAEPGAGGGAWTLTPAVRLTVPADTPSGVYTATLVVTIS